MDPKPDKNEKNVVISFYYLKILLIPDYGK
jgi:hypothetical protein